MKGFTRTTFATLAAVALFYAHPVFAERPTGLVLDPTPSTYRVPAPPEVHTRGSALVSAQATVQVNFLLAGANPYDSTVTCVAWTTAARTAFSYAADIWASQLQSAVPIKIDACYASSLGPGVLGQAGPVNFVHGTQIPGAPVADAWYAYALANAIAGTDLRPASADIQATFSSTFNWYYGTDGNTPITQVDFVSVVLHEIGHGLGFVGSANVIGSLGSWGARPVAGSTYYPFRFDSFTESNAGQLVVTYPNINSAALFSVLTSAVFFNGLNTRAGNGGFRAPLYAPPVWDEGSSYSHLAESFNNTPNALMTYSLAYGESIHSPGPVTLGILKDMGWTLQNASGADLSLSGTVDAATTPTHGKDVVTVFTAGNQGPGTATGVTVTLTPALGSTVIWASPGCVASGLDYVCTIGTMAPNASTRLKMVVRLNAPGLARVDGVITGSTVDVNASNNASNAFITVQAGPVAAPVLRYRLYSPVSLEHHFTTDLNEYTVLGGSGAWIQEGTVGKVLNNPGSFNGVNAIPYYRLYNTITRWHHWTTDANEYYTLGLFPGWNQEGVDGYLLPTITTGAMQLYRLVYPNGTGLHHWTVDSNEYTTLINTYGWVGEGGAGFVVQ